MILEFISGFNAKAVKQLPGEEPSDFGLRVRLQFPPEEPLTPEEIVMWKLMAAIVGLLAIGWVVKFVLDFQAKAASMGLTGGQLLLICIAVVGAIIACASQK